MEYSERDILQRIVNFQLYYFEKKNLKADNSVTFLYRIAQYELRHIKLDGVRTPRVVAAPQINYNYCETGLRCTVEIIFHCSK